MKSFSRWLAALLLLAAVGCSVLYPAGTSTPGGGVALPGQPSPTSPLPATDPTPQVTPSPAGPLKLILWLPPQFDPESGSPAGELLKARLASFSASHSPLEIEVRLKAVSGIGGLMETLSSASVVAPDVVPSLIVLPRTDLEEAALKGLIYPFEADAAGLQGSDWYAYARELAQVQGTVYGLPLAGDALVLLYRPASLAETPQNWEQILLSAQRLALPAGDPQALISLALYLSARGAIQDEQGRPVLQAEILQQVLDQYSRALGLGVILPGMVDVATDGLAWQTYQDGGANLVITWASRYLSEPPADTSVTLLPSLSAPAYALADGWSWALADPQPARRLLSMELAEYLADAGFLAEWSQAAGYLPVRPSSLDQWNNFNERDLAEQFALAAQLRPANDLTFSLGPVLQEAVRQVLTRQSDSLQAAEAAAERLAKPYLP